MLLLLLLLGVVTVLGSATPPLTLFVHPTDGSDEHDGTDASKPLATLTGAQRRLRSALLSETEARRDVVVELLPGSHRVPAGGLQLTLEDSPPGGEHWVRWRGAAYGGTSVHGGEPVTGWQPATDLGLPRGVMVAPAPRLPGGAARHLYVDGVRAARTRVNATLAVPGELSLEKKLRADGQDISDAYLTSTALNWSNAGDVEFVYAAGMAEPRCTIDHLEANSTTNRTKIYMKQPCMWNLINRDWGPVTTPPVWIENVKEHLVTPGQWYHDRAMAQVLYFPLPGVDVAKSTIVLAVEEILVKHLGVSRHSWTQVVFQYATWLRPMQGKGFVEQQAGACNVCDHYVPVPSEGCGINDDYVLTPGNVVVSNSHDLEFVNCTFRHLGANAASAFNASQSIAWRGCSFTDVSGGAVQLGGITGWNCNGGSAAFHGRGSHRPNRTCSSADLTTLDANFLIEDCSIYNLPVEYQAMTAIFGGYIASTTIQHNHVANTTYSAISLGWSWGREAAGVGSNRIVANKVESVLSMYCCDGGAIYTLGPQPNSSIERNHIVQPFRDDWPRPRQKCVNSSEHDRANQNIPGNYSGCSGKGIYHDNGSGGWNDTLNVFDGSWNRFMDVDAPWSGPVQFGPGNNTGNHGKPFPGPGAQPVGAWALCPGPDGRTNHDCSIGVDLTQKVGGRVNATMPCRINFTANWIRMVHPSGNGNGGYTACPPASWYDDALDIRPGWYRADPTLPEPCWAGVDNWMNGQVYAGQPKTTPGWPGWIHGVPWGPRPSPDPWAKGQRAVDVALPPAARAVMLAAGPRKKTATRL